MRLFWTLLWKSEAYRKGTPAERRMIEIRFTAARALRAKRRSARLTQQQLAARIGAAQSTISRIEQASDRVSLDVCVRAMLELNATDDEIAAAFNPGRDRGIATLRVRAAERFYPKPGVDRIANLARWGWRTRLRRFVARLS